MSELNLNEIKAHHERTLADDDQLTVSEHERGLLLAEVEKLNGALAIAQGMLGASRRQVDEATADVVSLSSRRQVLEARCAQMEADHAETVAEVERLRERLSKATRFEIDMLPEDDINASVWKISVEYRGRGKWAVLRSGRLCLGTDGVWDWESIPSEREDEWLAAHRYDLDTALRLAEEHAPKLVVNGKTAAEFQAELRGERP